MICKKCHTSCREELVAICHNCKTCQTLGTIEGSPYRAVSSVDLNLEKKPKEPKEPFRKRFERMAASYTEFVYNVNKLFVRLIIGGIISAIVGFGIFLLYNVIFANGLTENCYIAQANKTIKINGVNLVDCEEKPCGYDSRNKEVITYYELKRSINWREDSVIGSFNSVDEAKVAADKLSCPIK